MFGSSMLDIAIGMIYVFLLLSLIASTVHEILFSFMNMRGKELLRGFKTLLNDECAGGLVKDLYNHGQIYGLFRGEFNPKKPGNLPSYIPPQNFVMALLDVVPAAEPEGQALLVSLKNAAQKLAADPKKGKVGKPLLAMINAAGNDSEKLKKDIEAWYNSAMDRVSGWYKYKTQTTLFWIGVVLAAAINADTVSIMKQLSTDSTLRESIVAAAKTAKPPNTIGGQSVHDQIDQLRGQVSNINEIGIPFGWDVKTKDQARDWSSWPQRLLGWLLTAIAVSLGAPFWFDILNKFMVVRSTVKPREKSHEEESKDKNQKVKDPDDSKDKG